MKSNLLNNTCVQSWTQVAKTGLNVQHKTARIQNRADFSWIFNFVK